MVVAGRRKGAACLPTRGEETLCYTPCSDARLTGSVKVYCKVSSVGPCLEAGQKYFVAVTRIN